MRMTFGAFLPWQRQSSHHRSDGCWSAARRRGRAKSRHRARGRLSFRRLRAGWLVVPCCWMLLAAAAGAAKAQSRGTATEGPSAGEGMAGVSGNPAATNFSTGTGWLGRTLGLRDEWGITLGGLWLAHTNPLGGGGGQAG